MFKPPPLLCLDLSGDLHSSFSLSIRLVDLANSASVAAQGLINVGVRDSVVVVSNSCVFFAMASYPSSLHSSKRSWMHWPKFGSVHIQLSTRRLISRRMACHGCWTNFA